MAKELMEIGGFITEGAEIVNHDASLSGNGTVDSPLGVVPGYNETVLFTAAPGSPTTGTVVMSEPPSAFERVKVLEGRGYDSSIFHEFSGTQPDWNMTSVIIANDGTNFIIDAGKWTISNNSANKISDQRVTCKSTYVKEGGSFPKGIYAVIGINRIVNN